MSIKNYSISKTSFLKFEQCQKAFFLYKNHPYLKDKYSVDKQLTFKRGHDVGYFAHQLFPNGIDVSKETKGALAGAELTQQLIENKTEIIYEATFVYDGVLIMVDILCLTEGKYLAYEIKSSMKISETYLKDAYLQYYVLKNSLPQFDDLFLVTLNADYVLDGEIEPKKLFKKRSVKQKAEENNEYFAHQIAIAHQLLDENKIPNIAIGKHCFKPYQCDYFATCWKDAISEKSIFNLPQLDKTKLFEWFNSGIKTIEQVPDELLEKESQRKIKSCFISKAPIIDIKKIETFLAKVQHPIAAMDMEIWSPAIPQLPGTRPFEQVPFLVCFYDGENYTHFFNSNQPDNRQAFAQELANLSKQFASILVYDKTMEINVIDTLIKQVSEFKTELTELKSKLVDVFEVFLNLDYYHPDFKNNFSLKTVSSFLLSDINYTQVTSGLEAMNYFDQYRLSENEIEKEEIKTQLVDYCNMDSLATYRLMQFLQNLNK